MSLADIAYMWNGDRLVTIEWPDRQKFALDQIVFIPQEKDTYWRLGRLHSYNSTGGPLIWRLISYNELPPAFRMELLLLGHGG